jgi:hypothetical protein
MINLPAREYESRQAHSILLALKLTVWCFMCARVSFSQDPMEIFNDYELPVKASDSSPRNTPSEQEHRIHGSQSARTASAFAQLLSPVVEAAAASAQQLLKKRKRLHSDPEGSREGDNVSAKKLMNLARIGTRFADRFLDSMIRDNAAVLQGEDKDYLQRSW